MLAEDRGFEPLRAVNPTRIPSVRHRPLGESSGRNYTGRVGRFGPPGTRPCVVGDIPRASFARAGKGNIAGVASPADGHGLAQTWQLVPAVDVPTPYMGRDHLRLIFGERWCVRRACR